MVGDSPQALIVKLSCAEAERFLADRTAAGFNAIWVNLLCNTSTGGSAGRNDVRRDRPVHDARRPLDAERSVLPARGRRSSASQLRNGIVGVPRSDRDDRLARRAARRTASEKDFAYGRYLGSGTGRTRTSSGSTATTSSTGGTRTTRRRAGGRARDQGSRHAPHPDGRARLRRRAGRATTRGGRRSSGSTPPTPTTRRTRRS